MKVLVKGKNGTYPVVTGDEPLTATVVFGGQPAAIAGLCGETAFPAAQCAFNGSNTKPTCKP